jgi:CRISPR-associated protein Cas1
MTLRSRKTQEGLATGRAHIMGVEGRAAAAYWGVFALALGGKASFPGRHHRGATDIVNSLLNYGYAMLLTRTQLVIAQAGLEPQVSFLHAPQPSVGTLAFDLMEEFRPLVDKIVLALIGRHKTLRVDANGFLSQDTRDLLAAAFSRQLVALVPYRGLFQKVEDVMRLQARSLASHVAGEGTYHPFLMRW